ncbi:MAG: thiolase family protein [Planctomycetes bacterium]|nr:thiolase family protein [Planctomycetota bacterium]
MLRTLDGEVIVASAARTPIGTLDGILAGHTATALGAFAVKAAVERSGIDPGAVDEVFMGNVVGAGLGQNPAKQASRGAGLRDAVHCTTVNTVCSGGMAAVIEACRAILSGTASVVVAGGMESRTHAPFLFGPVDKKGNRVRGEIRGYSFTPAFPGPDATVDDYRQTVRSLRVAGFKESNTFEALACPFNEGVSMKDYAEKYAASRGWDAAFVDEYAAASYAAAENARDRGFFDDETVPVDGIPRDEIASPELQQTLRAKSASPCSSYNAPSLGDGAAALLLAGADRARELGLQPVARVTGFSRVDVAPQDFIAAPVAAARMLMDALGGEFDIFEGNESFGLQIPLFREEIPIEKQNVHGGAVALRHPLGAAGARIMVTMLHAMRRYDLHRGLATICFASGGAFATAVESA